MTDRPGGPGERRAERGEGPTPTEFTAVGEQHADDVLGAYVLDALDAQEQDAVGRAIAASPELAAQEHRLRHAMDELVAAGADPVPADLWDRVVGATIDSPRPGPVSGPVGVPMGRTGWSRRPRLWLPAAAALLVLLVALATAVSVIAGGGTPVEQRLRAEATTARLRGAAAGTLVGRDGPVVEVVATRDGRVWLFADRLPRLRADRTYQLWALDDGDPRSMGVLGADPRATRVRAPVVGNRLALTVEPAGGSPQPTGPPVAQGRLA